MIEEIPEKRFLFLRIFILLEYFLISFTFKEVIKSKLFNTLINFFFFIYFFISVYDYLTTNKSEFSYIPHVVECLLLLICIIFFFYEKMKINSNVIIYQTTIFWIAVAFTLYCAGNFFLFLFAKNAMRNESFKIQYTLIYSTFTILKNLFICIGLTIKEAPNEENSNLIKADDVWEIPAEYIKPKL